MRIHLALVAVAGALFGASCADRPESSAQPHTTHWFVRDIRQGRLDKLDLLFMIDNSISMADKQGILAQAVPRLLERLITPRCQESWEKWSPPPCAPGTALELEPIHDIHIGVISSSLGGHGAATCAPGAGAWNPTQNDHAQLIGGVRQSVPSHHGLGFLWWNPGGKKWGESDPKALEDHFTKHVMAAGESGCGYEAQLESWYRFLIDPAPPTDVVVENGLAKLVGVDEMVLKQRADFLRPDSLVAIVMLTDENDCSIVDGGQAFLAAETSKPDGTAFHLGRATSDCAFDPDSPCCRSCASSESATPAGCLPLGKDPECAKGLHDDASDHPNLRCWQQKRRFGVDFLYPTRRYVEALTQPRICPRWDATGPLDCSPAERVCNPLFARDLEDPLGCEKAVRHPALIYLAGIVGVPWQDLATEESLVDPTKLEYLTATALASEDRWRWLVPECKRTNDPYELPRPLSMCAAWDESDEPDDPLMIESAAPRSGKNPALNAPLVGPDGSELANPINGHEWLTSDGDLQYACIFPLQHPKDCSVAASGCDCADPGGDQNPLCQGGGSYSKVQSYAKAFPGTRELEVLKDFGENAIVASICPKSTADSSDPSSGYNSALGALIERLKPAFSGQCLNPPIAFSDGPAEVPRCVVVEVLPNDAGQCDPCDSGVGRFARRASVVEPVLERLRVTGQCTGSGCVEERFCMCELRYVPDRDKCEQTGAQPDNYGWCYVDPSQGVGNPALVTECLPARKLIFSGYDTPVSGATSFLACLGSAMGS